MGTLAGAVHRTPNSISYFRKIYKDAMGEGKSVLEMGNDDAIVEINNLHCEVKKILNIN